jgi:putative ABC transport system permease protein
MEKLVQDLRYAFRSLYREPVFALTAVLTLALGIGATTAIFSVVNTVMLRPLPFEEPERLVSVQNFWTERGVRSPNISAPDFYDWRTQSTSFEALGYWAGAETSVTIDGTADYAYAAIVTPGFLDAFRARTSIGRMLTDEEQRPGGPLAALITDEYWKRQFNADPSAIGTTIKFDEQQFTIVGVLRPGIRYPARVDIYFPAWIEQEVAERSAHNYRVIGRLRDGVSLEQAQSEMDGIARRLEQAYPTSNRGKLASVVPLQEVIVGNMRQTLLVLFGAVGVVLLIACANVANLLLARSSNRAREMVVRAAVGAGRGRLVRQLLTESFVLAACAALLGTWMARIGTGALIRLAPDTFPRLGEVQVDLAALGFALTLALGASVLFGLAPALQISRVQLADGLRQGGKGWSTGARSGTARSAFVVAEVALAVVLVVGAGLLARSLVALTSVDMGFDAERLLVLRTVVPVRSLQDAPRATAFYRELLEDVRSTPGVTTAAAVTSLPTQVRSNGGYWIEGGPTIDETGVSAPQALFTVVTPDYFRTLRVPIRRGRDFTDGDRLGAPMVAIINESLARQAFPGQDPIGRRIQCGLDSLEFMTIVGVVADVRTAGPAQPAMPELFMPYEQHPGPAAALNLVVRTESDNPLSLTETIRRKIASRNPDVPVKATTMDATLENAAATYRFRTYLLVLFASVALLLAVAGIYGVMSYTVSQRTPELGVRIALGATPGDIFGLVVGQGAWLAAIGIVIGGALSLIAGRLLEGLLFGVTARDPWSLAGVTVVVLIASLAACYLPGRRAVRVDPMVALRAE